MPEQNRPKHPDESITFHLGLTMAGAVSGGAFTAGAIDYLINAIEEWEQAKEENRRAIAEGGYTSWEEAAKDEDSGYDPSIPMHNVVIEVLGGASAGAIATVLTALGLLQEYRGHHRSFLRHAWVQLADEGEDDSTFSKLLMGSSGDQNNIPLSLLSSGPLDQVKDEIIAEALESQKDQKHKSFVAENLEMLLTITSLKRIPVQLRWSENGEVSHVMELHRGLAHLSVASGDDEGSDTNVIAVDFKHPEDLGLTFDLALSSGAFPIGLPPRQIYSLPEDYIKAQVHNMTGMNDLPNHLSIPSQEFEAGTFDLTAVDGGVMNNDPFVEVNRIALRRSIEKWKEENENALEDMTGEKKRDYDSTGHFTANIFIDPFPNFYEVKYYKQPRTMLDVARQLISAMLNQTRVKDKQSLASFINHGNYGMVFPSYTAEDEKYKAIEENPLASGGMGGFAGFLKQNLRKFDYQLGRRNIQSFLQHHFHIRYDYMELSKDDDTSKRMASDLGTEGEDYNNMERVNDKALAEMIKRWQLNGDDIYSPMRRRFGVPSSSKEGAIKIPIIPDLNIRGKYKPKNTMERVDVNEDWWYLSKSDISRFRRPISVRINTILQGTLASRTNGVSWLPIGFGILIIALLIYFIRAELYSYLYWAISLIFVLAAIAGLVYRSILRKLSRLTYNAIEETLRDRGQVR